MISAKKSWIFLSLRKVVPLKIERAGVCPAITDGREMDIDLLAKMVGELILENDEVALPGVGTFVAEFVGASFSDKGFTINPPYRKLSFRQREGDSDLLVDFYARTNSLDKSTAKDLLTRFLAEMKEVLKTKKVIIFPGLGRLRATKENLFFFVPDEELNIYPEGFGLEPVSLKSHEELEEVTEIEETAAVVAEIQAPADKTATTALPGVPPATETPENVAAAAEIVQEATKTPENVAEEATAPDAEVKRAVKPWLKALLIILAIAAALLVILAILGRVAPNLVDPLLYTKEELEILYQ